MLYGRCHNEAYQKARKATTNLIHLHHKYGGGVVAWYRMLSGVGTSCGLGGPRCIGRGGQTMLVSNEINKDRIHTYRLQWVN